MLVLLDFSALSPCQTRDMLSKHRGTLTTQPLSINRFIKILFWMTWSCKHLSIKLKNNFSILNQIIALTLEASFLECSAHSLFPLNWKIWVFKTGFENLQQKQSNSRGVFIKLVQKHIDTRWPCIFSCI